MRIRIKFRKYGVMKFIGHLDIMRYFQKCIRRAGIDIAYSEGYHPHPLMSFAAPLGVGITSDGEYFDIVVNSSDTSKHSLYLLNEVMAEGIEVVSYRRLLDSDAKAMSAVAAADYKLRIRENYEVPQMDYEAALKEFFYKPEEILITKKTKKSEKVMDLKKLVYDFQIEKEQERPIFYLKVCTGSTDNLKPELVLHTFFERFGKNVSPLSVQIHRIDVYGEKDGTFLSLGEMGEIIE